MLAAQMGAARQTVDPTVGNHTRINLVRHQHAPSLHVTRTAGVTSRTS
jgi:hypothetical protein